VPDFSKLITRALEAAKGIGAWHASPHKFERFDISKIGTGQGAGSYGHGLYAAENRAVSGPLGTYDFEFTNKNLGKQDMNQAEGMVFRGLRSGKSEMDVLSDLARNGATFDEANDILQRVKRSSANLYAIDIKAKPSELLDWDKRLPQQSPFVQEALQNVPSNRVRTWLSDPDVGATARGENIYEALSGSRGNQFASDALRDVGIPGMRYLDEHSRRAAEEIALHNNLLAKSQAQGTPQAIAHYQRMVDAHSRFPPLTSNYVLFRDDIIDILKRYGIAPPLVGGGAATMGLPQPQPQAQ